MVKRLFCILLGLSAFAILSFGEPVRLYPVPIPTEGETRYGYIDRTGEIVIEPVFLEATHFQYSFARTASRESENWGFARDIRFGLIDSSGGWVLRPKYENLFAAGYQDRFWVKVSGYWMLIDVNSEVVIDEPFLEVSRFAEGKAVVVKDSHHVVLDESGAVLFSLTELGFSVQHPEAYADDRLLALERSSAAGLRTIVFLDGEGEVAIPARTYLAGGINPFSQGYAALQEPAPGKIGGGEAFFIDRHGERAFGGRVWRGVKSFSEGLAAVSTLSASPSQHRPARWGFIDRNGEMVIEDIYWDVEPFSEGLAAVAVELDSLVPGNRDGLWGAIDQNGVMVIEPQFRSPFRFRDGLAQLFEPYEIHSIAGVQLSGPIRGTTMRYIDRNGRTVWDERDHRPVD